MRQLDSFNFPPARATLLKIDVQGFELQVLRGGARFIQDVSLIECELSIAALSRGATADARDAG